MVEIIRTLSMDLCDNFGTVLGNWKFINTKRKKHKRPKIEPCGIPILYSLFANVASLLLHIVFGTVFLGPGILLLLLTLLLDCNTLPVSSWCYLFL